MANLEKELHDKFLEMLRERIPERGKTASFLMDVLRIEKEAVYRRLRGEVPFTFAEIAVLTKKLNLSLDSVLEVVPTYRGQIYRMFGQDYFGLTEIDYKMSSDYVATIKAAGKNAYSEYGFAYSMIPMHFSLRYPSIFRLYMLKWMYQFGDPETVPTYASVVIPDRLKGFHNEYLEAIQHIKYTYFVWDKQLLNYAVNDIKYFNSIHVMSDEDVALIKEDLANFLNELERLTQVEAYDTGNKVEIYVSNLNFETTYSYLVSNNLTLAMVSAFALSSVTSVELEACEYMKMWVQSLKRTSTLISGCAEVDRRMFFKKQWEYLGEI